MKKHFRKVSLICVGMVLLTQLSGCSMPFLESDGLSWISDLVQQLSGRGTKTHTDTDNRVTYMISEKDAELVVEHDNGDTVYRPEESSLVVDKKSEEIYYDNLVIAYTFSDLNKDAADELADRIGGAVIGDISGAVNRLQILVEPTDLKTLNRYADILMESEDVLYASYEIPIYMTEENTEENGSADQNPWSADGVMISDKDGESPDGNDWWAEAIGAYSAWDYVDSHPEAMSEITVGILDSGFDINHEDLGNKISIMNDNSPTDHGTHVAGIIAAENNTVGIRGIADSAELICVDWSSGEDKTNLLASGEWVELTKQMIESGARVVNNSWGAHVKSSESYYSEIVGDSGWLTSIVTQAGNFLGIYDSYMETNRLSSTRSAMESILLLVSLELSSDQDFLMIHAAGNGYDNGKAWEGYDTLDAWYYAAMSENTYDMLSESVRNQLEDLGITYNSIRNHVIVVGSVENGQDENGNYYMSGFSNYGSNVDICAPGEEIFSTLTILDDDDSEKDNERDGLIYGSQKMIGTSMAAPMVSGAAALVWALDPSLSAEEVKAVLTDEANTGTAIGVTGEDKGNIYRMLNVGKAVEAVAGAFNSRVADQSTVEEENLLDMRTDATDYENLVTSAYSESIGNMSFDIPRINIDSECVSVINQEIWDTLYSGEAEEIIEYINNNYNYDGDEYISYEWYVNNNILSLVIVLLIS